jgi:hypothetical protein
MTADATSIIPVQKWKSPIPPRTSDVWRRRAPAIEAANAPLAPTNVARRRNVPRDDT